MLCGYVYISIRLDLSYIKYINMRKKKQLSFFYLFIINLFSSFLYIFYILYTCFLTIILNFIH